MNCVRNWGNELQSVNKISSENAKGNKEKIKRYTKPADKYSQICLSSCQEMSRLSFIHYTRTQAE